MRFYLNNHDAGYPEFATVAAAIEGQRENGGAIMMASGQAPLTADEIAALSDPAIEQGIIAA